MNWTKVTGATGYKVYGRATGAQQLLATVGDVATWTDTGSVTPSGALPTTNTTGMGEGTSTDVVVASGATATIGLFVASGSVPAGVYLTVKQDTPGGDNTLAGLGREQMSVVIAAPGTYRVTRPNIADKGVAVGVFSES